MDTYGASSDAHGRGEVAIGIARHVYGPASVHLLPCKIHHTGHAPVATYFRPTPPLAEGGGGGGGGGGQQQRNSSDNNNRATALAGADSNVGEGAPARQRNSDPSSNEADSGGSGGGAGGGGSAGENDNKPVDVVVDEGEGGRGGRGEGGAAAGDDQKWEVFEDDSAEHTARFRGRKFVGRKVELPEGVHGVVLREQPCPDGVREENEDVASYWATETSFKDVMVWGHDQVRRESTVDRGLAWLEISKSIHDP